MKFYFIFFIFSHIFSQNKGTLYLYYGWNVSSYSKSDIHFQGEGFDFTLYDVKAKDKQNETAISPYLRIDEISIPQTNIKIGYFFHDNWDISLGYDHMKYVAIQNQQIKIDGEINNGSKYDGIYKNEEIFLTDDFLQFEHTDGLNYINAELTYNKNLLGLLNIKSKKHQFNILAGGGFGLLFPKTNATVLNKERYDDFHISGYGVSLKTGLNLVLFKYFFLQTEMKLGYINMPDIRITHNSSDTASQDFFFLQNNAVFGFRYKL